MYIVQGMGNVTRDVGGDGWEKTKGKWDGIGGWDKGQAWIPARIQRSIHHGAWAVIQPYAQPHIILDETICEGEGNADWHLDDDESNAMQLPISSLVASRTI